MWAIMSPNDIAKLVGERGSGLLTPSALRSGLQTDANNVNITYGLNHWPVVFEWQEPGPKQWKKLLGTTQICFYAIGCIFLNIIV